MTSAYSRKFLGVLLAAVVLASGVAVAEELTKSLPGMGRRTMMQLRIIFYLQAFLLPLLLRFWGRSRSVILIQ